MAKKIYSSTGGLSNEVTKIYGSVGGLSSNVIKGYCSVGGLSKLFWGGGSGGEYSGFWFYNSTLAEKIIQGKRYTVVPAQVQVDINKRANGIAFYFFIQEIDSGSIIENLTITVSTDANATPYNAVSQGQTDPYTNSTSIVVNNDTWYYTVGAPLDYDYFPTSPADMTPNCIVNNSIISSYYDIDDIVRGFLETYVYTDDFAEDYQVGQAYNLNIGDKEKTLRKAIAIFLFKNVAYSSYNSYQQACIHLEDIVNFILTNIASYNVIGINCSYNKDVNRVEVSVGRINISPPTNVEIWTKNIRNGYTQLTNNIPSPYTANSYIRCWFNNNESYMRTQIVQQGYNVSNALGVEIRNYSNQNNVTLTNIGLKF